MSFTKLHLHPDVQRLLASGARRRPHADGQIPVTRLDKRLASRLCSALPGSMSENRSTNAQFATSPVAPAPTLTGANVC